MRALLAVLAVLAFQAQAQTTGRASPSTPSTLTVVPIALQVERLAPQLVAFAGSQGNFENLVNGIALGVPVTLTTVGADGLVQTVTFANPGGAVANPADIARVLENARQQLIAAGIAAPTAQQLGEAISGTTVPVTVGTIPGQPGAATAAGASAAAGASPAQQIQSRSTALGPRINTSDSPLPANTSTTPTPPAPVVGVPPQPVAPAATPSTGRAAPRR